MRFLPLSLYLGSAFPDPVLCTEAFQPVTSKPASWQMAAVLTVGILSVSTSAIFIRLALLAAGTQGPGFSLVLAAARLGIAAIALLPGWPGLWQSRVPRQALGYSIAAGIALAVHFATWITSLSYTSVAASTALVTTNPVWVALLSWLWLGDRPSAKTVTGIAIALVGSGIVSLAGSDGGFNSHPLLGNALALVGSWMVSLYFLLGREAQRQGLSIGQHIVLTYSTAALALLPLPLLWGSSYRGYPLPVYGYILLMAIFPQLIGHTSFNWAVRWISPTLVTLTILAEPIGSSLFALLLFNENPGLLVLLGAGVLLLGVAIAALGNTDAAPTSNP